MGVNWVYRRVVHPLIQTSLSNPVDDTSRFVSLVSKTRAGNPSWAGHTCVPRKQSTDMVLMGILKES